MLISSNHSLRFLFTEPFITIKLLSRIQLFPSSGSVASQAPLSMRCTRQEYWSGLPFPSPGDPLNPGIEPRSPELQVASLPLSPQGNPERKWKVKVKVAQSCLTLCDPHGLYSPWNSLGQNTEWLAFPFSRGSSQPRDLT